MKELSLNKKLSLSARDKEGGISVDVAKSLPVGLQDVKIRCTN